MSWELEEIKNKEDAVRLSEIVIKSLADAGITFNPFQGRIFELNDGTILFMGDALSPEEAPVHIANHVWDNRKRVNRQIKKWRISGCSKNFNCGC